MLAAIAATSASVCGWRDWRRRAASAFRAPSVTISGDRLPYTFEDMGEQSVKNIARPVRAYTLRPESVASLQISGGGFESYRDPFDDIRPQGNASAELDPGFRLAGRKVGAGGQLCSRSAFPRRVPRRR